MNIFKNITALIICFFTMLFLLLFSVWLVCYTNPDYYKKEFIKYRVYEDIGIGLDDLVDVNTQMLDYLIDKKDSLADITSTINGEANVPFFNAKEIAHMEDVKNLFMRGLSLIYICLFISIAFLAILVYAAKKQALLILADSMLVGAVLFLVMILSLSAVIATDFTKYFIIFHEIFFTNDLWMLNPATDRLINMVPEGFFIDTAKYIAFVYASLVLTLLAVSTFIKKKMKK